MYNRLDIPIQLFVDEWINTAALGAGSKQVGWLEKEGWGGVLNLYIQGQTMVNFHPPAIFSSYSNLQFLN